jgi:hypothetical protein
MTTHTPVAPPVPTQFPPNFLDVVELSLRASLKRDYPQVRVVETDTWLNLYDGMSLALLDSVVEVFLGRLTLAGQAQFGWFTSADSVADSERVAGLNQQQIEAIYTQLKDELSPAYRKALGDYWEVVEDDGKTRQTLYLDEFVSTLKLEAQVGVEQGSLTVTQWQMLLATLLYARQSDPDALQPHGLYSLSLSWSQLPPMELAGCFVLSETCNAGVPATQDGRMGAVLLYTPNRGLEGFASLPALNDSLSRRLADPAEKDWLLHNTENQRAASVMNVLATAEGHIAHTWNYIPMGSNFIDIQFIRQLSKQQADFTYCVELAKAGNLGRSGFLSLLAERLDPRHQFDNFINLDRNQRMIVHDCMPARWKAQSVQEKNAWLAQARTYGDSITELLWATEKQHSPELDSKAFIAAYIDDILSALLDRKKVSLGPDNLYVEITYYSWPVPAGFGSATLPNPPHNHFVNRYSLRSLAYEKAAKSMLNNAQSIVVCDESKAPIPQLNEADIRALVEQIDVDAAFDRFLNVRLKTSPYGQTLRTHADQLTLAQMRLGLWQARNDGFEPVGLRWISAVLDAPLAASRQPVKSANSPTPQPIHLRFMQINDTPLPNVMLIAPANATERTAMVVCTLNAPDGVVFRWFNFAEAFRRGFVHNRAFAEYLLLQLPIAKRPGALTSIEVDLWLRAFRFPTVFRYLPQTVSLPDLLWELETYTGPSGDFLAHNHNFRLQHMISDAKGYWDQARGKSDRDHSAMAHLAISVALLFLPTPVMIPLALGMALYTAWEGFRTIDEDDYQGATEEFLTALSYLTAAGIGKLSLSRELVSPISLPRAAPPLVRRIGPDGQQYIGYLLSPSVAPRLSRGGSLTAYDPANFLNIEIHDEPLLVSKHFNLFGHARLYRQSRINPKVLVHSGEYGIRGKNGLWLKAPYQPRGTGPHIYRRASIELTSLTVNWPTSVATLSMAEKARFEADYMTLAMTSNTEFLPDVLAYCEAGSAEINHLLRTRVHNAMTRQFLRQFYRLNAYQGMAFRVAYVTAAGLLRLRSKAGLCFTDNGVQSASVSRFNAMEWSREPFITQNATAGNQLVFMVFDKSIPKKNLFTHLLGDHVGVPPGTPMRLTASREVEGKAFFYFTSPQSLDDELFDLYSGEREIII